ncbi:uncharacterized protein PRD47_019400 isoform 6-T6 [Ara ararauna]
MPGHTVPLWCKREVSLGWDTYTDVKGYKDVVLLDTWSSCQAAWWCQSQGVGCKSIPEQLAQTVSSKLSLPCPFRFLPVIEKKYQDELKQPRPAARPPMQLPEYALKPSGMEMSSLHTKRADKQLQLLMAFKRQEVEAEVWRKYYASRTGQSMEPGKSPCRYVFEDPYCPPHLLRKAYAEKLKERLQEKEVLQEERCQSAARQTASKGQAELHLLGRAWGGVHDKWKQQRNWKILPSTCCCLKAPQSSS